MYYTNFGSLKLFHKRLLQLKNWIHINVFGMYYTGQQAGKIFWKGTMDYFLLIKFQLLILVTTRSSLPLCIYVPSSQAETTNNKRYSTSRLSQKIQMRIKFRRLNQDMCFFYQNVRLLYIPFLIWSMKYKNSLIQTETTCKPHTW